MGCRSIWDGDKGGFESGVVVEEGDGREGEGGLVVCCRWDDGVVSTEPLEEVLDLSIVRGRSEGVVDGRFLDPYELLVVGWQRDDHRRAALGGEPSCTDGVRGLEDGLLAVDAIKAVCKTRRNGLRDDVGVGDREENSARHRV